MKLHRPPKQYVIDDLARKHGHDVLRLPPYHCFFNPIELCWSIEKGWTARKNTTGKLPDVRKLFGEGRQRVVDEKMWPNFVKASKFVIILLTVKSISQSFKNLSLTYVFT